MVKGLEGLMGVMIAIIIGIGVVIPVVRRVVSSGFGASGSLNSTVATSTGSMSTLMAVVPVLVVVVIIITLVSVMRFKLPDGIEIIDDDEEDSIHSDNRDILGWAKETVFDKAVKKKQKIEEVEKKMKNKKKINSTLKDVFKD